MEAARAKIERGNAITTESIGRKTAEQRAWEKWSATIDKTSAMRIRLERESAQAAVAAANAVNLGYATQEQALSTLMALEARHATQLQAVADQTQRMTQSANAAASANDNLARSMSKAGGAAEAGSFQTANIAAQFQDVGVTAAMGMNPIMIALQQGTQLSAVLQTMQNPLRGLAAAFVSIINPVSLLTIGFVALAAAAIQFFASSGGDADKAAKSLEEHDRWLDQILRGYEGARQAAKLVADEAQRLPRESAVLALDNRATAQAQEYAAAMERIFNTPLDAVRQAQPAFEALYAQIESQITAFQSGAITADEFQNALNRIKFSDDVSPRVVGLVDTLLGGIQAASLLRNEFLQTSRAAEALAETRIDPRQFWTGVSDALEDFRRRTVDVRTEQERLEAQFAGAVAMARTTGEITALVAAYDNMQRSAQAAAWAVKNSGDAAVVAAGQYGTAEGAANSYANAMWRLGNMIPQVAAAQAALVEMKTAEQDFAIASDAASELLRKGAISRAEYNERLVDTKLRYEEARDVISGVTALETQLAQQTAQNSIDALSGREQALARVNLMYADQAKQIEGLALATVAERTDLLAQNSIELERALANTNAQFDQTAAKAAGAGSALTQRSDEEAAALFAAMTGQPLSKQECEE